MCTVVTLFRPGHAWPLLLAANRDELTDRAWSPPARHWPSRPGTTAGRDHEAGGTWLGINDSGVVAGILNRVGSLGPAHGKTSRGILPLLALDHDTAEAAADALTTLDGHDFRPFNMVIGDTSGAWWVRWAGNETENRPSASPIPEGLHMLTALDIDDETSPRVRRPLPLFRAAAAPAPEENDWSGWAARLADRSRDDINQESGAVLIDGPGGFATTSSSLIGLARDGRHTIWHFAAGPPDKVSFVPVSLTPTDCV